MDAKVSVETWQKKKPKTKNANQKFINLSLSTTMFNCKTNLFNFV